MYQNNPLDEKIDRKHSDSVKYGAGNRDPEREKLLPLWVADMDFRVPDPATGQSTVSSATAPQKKIIMTLSAAGFVPIFILTSIPAGS